MLRFSVLVLVLLAVSAGLVLLMRVWKKKDEASCRRWSPWICLVILGVFVLAVVQNAPSQKSRELTEYTVLVDGDVVADEEQTEVRIEGDSTVLEVGIDGKEANLKVIPQSPWKRALGKLFPLTLMSVKEFDQGSIGILHFSGMDEYYLVITFIGNESLRVADNRGSVFHVIETNLPELGVSTYRYCACIGDPDGSYILTIDGTDIRLMD